LEESNKFDVEEDEELVGVEEEDHEDELLDDEEEDLEDELLDVEEDDLEDERPPMEPPDAAIAACGMAAAAAAASSRAKASGISRGPGSSWTVVGGGVKVARLLRKMTGKRRLGAGAGARRRGFDRAISQLSEQPVIVIGRRRPGFRERLVPVSMQGSFRSFF
jgi:hypothetical protein